MKRSKYTEETIIGILKERQGGMTVADLTRKYGVSEQSIYRWQAKYGGMEVSEAKRLRQLDQGKAFGVFHCYTTNNPANRIRM